MQPVGAIASLLAALLLALGMSVAEGSAPARVEARSEDFLVVGTVQGEHMTIHVSRIADNAPVRDATVSVVLRGSTHPAAAEADGSYSLSTQDLAIPGTAAVQFDVTEGRLHEISSGTLELGAGGQGEDKGSSRQIGWWALNVIVCVGFLVLWSRRRRRNAPDE